MRNVTRRVLVATLLVTAGASTAQGQVRPDQLFQQLDTNRDGVVSRAEFVESRHTRFLALDRNHDGVLDAADTPHFAAFVSPRAARARAMLARLDLNHDGRVSEPEFVQASLQMFDLADANHDGLLTRQEGEVMKRQSMMQAGDR